MKIVNLRPIAPNQIRWTRSTRRADSPTHGNVHDSNKNREWRKKNEKKKKKKEEKEEEEEEEDVQWDN